MAERRSVLVVEDDEGIRETVADLLQHEGFDVSTAANGREALELLRREPDPCCVMLDLMMPVMDGWQLMDILRSEQRLDSLPVVVMTGARGAAMPPGAVQYLKKPIALDALIDAVNSVCTCDQASGPPS